MTGPVGKGGAQHSLLARGHLPDVRSNELGASAALGRESSGKRVVGKHRFAVPRAQDQQVKLKYDRVVLLQVGKAQVEGENNAERRSNYALVISVQMKDGSVNPYRQNTQNIDGCRTPLKKKTLVFSIVLAENYRNSTWIIW